MALSKPDWARVIEAIRFAAQKHRDQRRPDAFASPFVNHLIDSVDLAARVGRVTDTPLLVAVALHDALANTTATAVEIERRFGAEVRQLVEEVSDAPRLTEAERRKRRLAWAKTASPRARVIRLATMTATLTALPAHRTAAERKDYLKWMATMSQALGGTNAPLAALLAERIRQEFLRPFTPLRPTLTLPRPALNQTQRRRARQIVSKTARAAEDLEKLADEIERILRDAGIREEPVPGAHQPRGTSRRPQFADESLKRQAAPGVGALEVTALKDRAMMVAIDGTPPEGLPAALAETLQFLASGPRQPDGFPAFRTYEEIDAEAARTSGKRLGRVAIAMRLRRLRCWLGSLKGLSPLLVETAPGRRARFRLRVRREPEVVEAT